MTAVDASDDRAGHPAAPAATGLEEPDRPPPLEDARDPTARAGVGGRVEALLRRIDRFQRNHRSLAVLVGVAKKFGDDQAGNLAALVAYYSFFSLFPLLLLLTTLVGFVLAGDPEAQQSVVDSVLDHFPGLSDQLSSNIGAFQGSGVALVVGALGALWGGLGALGAMQNAMNTIWAVRIDERPPFLVERARSIIMLGVLGSGALATTIVTNVAASLGGLPLLARAIVLVATTMLNVGLFLLAFKVLTRHSLAWRQLLPGSIVAGIAFVALQTIGGVYVDVTLGRAMPLYGTFAVVLGLLTWLFIQAQVTVLAAELNVVLAWRLYPRSLIGNDLVDLTAADERALEIYADGQRRHPLQRVTVTFSDGDDDDDDQASISNEADLAAWGELPPRDLGPAPERGGRSPE